MGRADPPAQTGPGWTWGALTRHLVASCPACHKPMTATVMVSLTGEHYCIRHSGQPPCIACMAPADPGVGTEVGLCRRCSATSVRTQQDVKRVLSPIAAQLRRLSIRTVKPVRVRLVSAAELRGRHAGHGEALGMTVSRGANVVDLMIVRDLPFIKFGSTVAHEVMHVYLAQQHYPRLSPMVAEGLCQLLAYAWVRRQRDVLADAEKRLIAESPDPVYGDGFRRAKAGVERVGIRQLLDHVRQHGDLPAEP